MVKANRTTPSRGRFFLVLAAVAIAGAAAIGYAAMKPKPGPVAVDPNAPRPQAEGVVLGSPSAPVEIVEFADFECPACGKFATLQEPDVRARIVDKGLARLRFYYFPLDMHKNAWAASHAAACANDQGKFWEMHDRIFMGQLEWNGQATKRPKGVFEKYAREIGLDLATWESCYDSEKHRAQIQAQFDEGIRRKVNSTPTFIIGSRMFPSMLTYDQIKAYVDTATMEAAAAAK